MLYNNAYFSRFDSPEEYLSYLSGLNGGAYAHNERRDFYGLGWKDAKYTLCSGTSKYVADAQALINKMADENVFSTSRPELTTQMVGFLPNVPAYLSGQPETMYNITHTENESNIAPLSIYVETLISAGLSHKEIIARGTAVMAFALAMNNIRPVSIYTVCISKPYKSNHNAGIVCAIPTKPLDIERAAFMLCDPAFSRRLAFQAMADHAGSPNKSNVNPWAYNGNPTTKEYEANMRLALQLEPHDVFIYGGYSLDQLMLDNPIQWVKNMIAKHRGDVS
jgi:hypothetical protein